MTISDKDQQVLITTPNKALANLHVARVFIESVPEPVLKFYEENASKIGGEVVIVRTKADAGSAANRRNNASKILFLFGDEYTPDSYFTGVADRLKFRANFFKRYAS